MEEKKNHSAFKKVLFIGILFLMLLPLLQELTGILNIDPLKGYFEEVEKPVLSKEDWWSGKYQEEYEEYKNQNIGFRPFFVRTYNQLQFSLYDQVNAEGVFLGKEGYLYEKQYIISYLGRDFIGEEKIKEKVEKLNKIKDTLQSKGKEIIVIFAPGKGSFYPEYIPDEYNPKERTTTNYEIYRKEIESTGIHFLDFNKWFINTKNASPYSLFPQKGIHWSKYGEIIAADSIIRYVNSLHQHKKLPQLMIGKINTSYRIRDTDNDIEKVMNLLFSLNSMEMAYPEYQFKENSDVESPRVLTIADSFYWGMFNFGLSRDCFKGQFWYYNQQIYPESYDAPLNVEDIDIIKEIEKNDVVILLSTEGNLYKFAFGFIDQVHAAYFDKE